MIEKIFKFEEQTVKMHKQYIQLTLCTLLGAYIALYVTFHISPIVLLAHYLRTLLLFTSYIAQLCFFTHFHTVLLSQNLHQYSPVCHYKVQSMEQLLQVYKLTPD